MRSLRGEKAHDVAVLACDCVRDAIKRRKRYEDLLLSCLGIRPEIGRRGTSHGNKRYKRNTQEQENRKSWSPHRSTRKEILRYTKRILQGTEESGKRRTILIRSRVRKNAGQAFPRSCERGYERMGSIALIEIDNPFLQLSFQKGAEVPHKALGG